MERRKKKRLKTVRKGNKEEEKGRRVLAEEGCTGEKKERKQRKQTELLHVKQTQTESVT